MGREKAKWEEGYSYITGTVCSECFDDYGIKKFIANNSNANQCSYCDSNKPDIEACDFEKVVVHVLDSMKCEWGDPSNEGVGWESREGGWLGANVHDTHDLIYDILAIEVENEQILSDLNSAIIMGQWCKKSPYSLDENERLIYAWEQFSELVKHTSRYVFFKKENNASPYDEMDPVEILDSLGDIIGNLDLVNILTQEEKIFRVRIVNDGEVLHTAAQLGSPPTDKATLANRMSPAGISMFYGAFDIQTSIAETYEPEDGISKNAICGTFNPVRKLTVIDLSEKFEIPSLFDEDKRDDRFALKFLQDFITDFAKPIERIDSAHVDYVPTQIVTEYFKHLYMNTELGVAIDGIIYPSSKKHGGKCIVIFANSDQCVDPSTDEDGSKVLVLNDVEIKKI